MNDALIIVALIVLAVVLGEWLGGPTTLFRNPLTKRALRSMSRLWRRRD